MKIQMQRDEDILDIDFRKKVIQEIEGTENINRKRAQAAYLDVLRDGVRPLVLERLSAQGFKPETLAIMSQRATSINLMKKIVGKKARSYSKGVSRTVEADEAQAPAKELKPGELPAVKANQEGVNQATEDVETVADAMKLTKAMKRADTYRKAAKNCLLYIYPDMVENPEKPGEQMISLCTKVFFPHLYDAIPDSDDREKMRCFILSPFTQSTSYASQPSIGNGDGRNLPSYANPVWRSDGVDQTIANSPADSKAGKAKQYIFWTGKYHLTCNANGEIIPGLTPPENKNPIGRLPAVNLTEEQDGEFWARGGDDLMEGTILINLKMTDMESILHMQGWGQLVVTGQNIKSKSWAVGPQVALVLDSGVDAEKLMDAKILQHDPQTENHMKSTELHVAMLLTTNNLSVKSVATNLEVGSVASAIAKMVDESENMDDISEDQNYYADRERDALTIAEAWLVTLRGVPGLAAILNETKPLQVAKVSTTFHNIEAVVTENEKLTNLEARKKLGVDSMVDLIKKDNPLLSDAQAEAKLLTILNERVRIQKIDPTFLASGQGQGGTAVANLEIANGETKNGNAAPAQGNQPVPANKKPPEQNVPGGAQ